jgi:uncharacterized membrane protein YfcA
MSGLEQIQGNLSGPALLAVLAAMGLVAGIFAGLFGVGGAFLVNPLAISLLGMDESLVIGSGLSFIIGTSASGVGRHMRSHNVEFRSAISLGVGAMGGAALGTLLHTYLKGYLGEGPFHILILILFASLLCLTAWLVFRDSPPHTSGRALLQRLPLPPHVDLPAVGIAGVSVPGLALLGLCIGMVTGMLGVGGGVLFVPLLILAVGFTPHQAVGTSLGVVLLASMSGAVSHFVKGHVSLWIAMSLLVGSSVGIQIGVAICDRLHAKKLRRGFSLVLLMAASLLLMDVVRGKAAPKPQALVETSALGAVAVIAAPLVYGVLVSGLFHWLHLRRSKAKAAAAAK